MAALVAIGGFLAYGKYIRHSDESPASADSQKPASRPAQHASSDDKLHILSDVPNSLPEIKIVKDLNIRTVYFCKGTYKAKQIFIDNIDVVARISNILKEDAQKNNWFCEMILGRALDEGGLLGNGEELDITIEGSRTYGISISLSKNPASSFPFFIDTERNLIVYTDGGVLGTLK